MSFINSTIFWMQEKLEPLGGFGLFLLAFSEASFNPIPVETLFILLCLTEPSMIPWFTLIAIGGSVLGGTFGYFIGLVGEIAILEKLFSKEKIERVHKMYEKNGSLVVFLAGFTPIPYKLITISSGVFYINFKKFILASFAGRGLRFSTEGVLLMIFGTTIVFFIKKYLNVISIILAILCILIYLVYKNQDKILSIFGKKQKAHPRKRVIEISQD